MRELFLALAQRGGVRLEQAHALGQLGHVRALLFDLLALLGLLVLDLALPLLQLGLEVALGGARVDRVRLHVGVALVEDAQEIAGRVGGRILLDALELVHRERQVLDLRAALGDLGLEVLLLARELAQRGAHALLELEVRGVALTDLRRHARLELAAAQLEAEGGEGERDQGSDGAFEQHEQTSRVGTARRHRQPPAPNVSPAGDPGGLARERGPP